MSTSHFPKNPVELVTAKFKPKNVLYQNNGFVVVDGWRDPENDNEFGYACRWHYPDKPGHPQINGKPIWLVIPVDYSAVNLSNNPFKPGALTVNFEKDIIETCVLGSMVHDKVENEWYCLAELPNFETGVVGVRTYSSGVFRYLPIERFDEMFDDEEPLAIEVWHGERTSIWISPERLLCVVSYDRITDERPENLRKDFTTDDRISTKRLTMYMFYHNGRDWISAGEELVLTCGQLAEHGLIACAGRKELKYDDVGMLLAEYGFEDDEVPNMLRNGVGREYRSIRFFPEDHHVRTQYENDYRHRKFDGLSMFRDYAGIGETPYGFVVYGRVVNEEKQLYLKHGKWHYTVRQPLDSNQPAEYAYAHIDNEEQRREYMEFLDKVSPRDHARVGAYDYYFHEWLDGELFLTESTMFNYDSIMAACKPFFDRIEV